MNFRNQTFISGNSIMLSYFATVEVSAKLKSISDFSNIDETK